MSETFDVVIIGAGPGGYVAAIRAAQLGLKAAIVEKEFIGGTCLNRGCIPTKSIVAVAERFVELKNGHFAGFGITNVGEPKLDMKHVIDRKNKIVESLRGGIAMLFKARKIEVLKGHAKFVSPQEIEVAGDSGTQKVSAKNFVIATGSTWKPLGSISTDGATILNSDHVLDMTELPKRLLILGGGVIGCEFASIMNSFGVEVTVVEFMDQLLPTEDASVARGVALAFKKRGIKVITKTTVESVSGGRAKLSNGEDVEFDKMMISVGRKPMTDGLALEAAGVATERGFILTDAHLATNVGGIYAIGDVSAPKGGKPMLAHVASREGIVAVENIARKLKGESVHKMDYSVVPRPIFTTPEIGCVGLTEKQLKESGRTYKTGRFAYGALSKAICDSATDGMMIVYTDEAGQILGAHGYGANATSAAAELALAMQNKISVHNIAETIHAHPTYSEIVAEACEDSFGMAIHKAR